MNKFRLDVDRVLKQFTTFRELFQNTIQSESKYIHFNNFMNNIIGSNNTFSNTIRVVLVFANLVCGALVQVVQPLTRRP